LIESKQCDSSGTKQNKEYGVLLDKVHHDIAFVTIETISSSVALLGMPISSFHVG
jgi:hypothetical protein